MMASVDFQAPKRPSLTIKHTSFQKTPSKDIPPILEDFLRTVAKTGKTVYPWQQLKILFVQKLEQVMEQFHKDDPCDHHAPFPNVENTKFNEMRQRIIDAFQRFTGAPFTVQRICELVTQPKKHYTQCDKFLRGIEKNVMVVSTVDPCGRKIVSESRTLVNGLDTNGLNNQQRGDLNDITDGQPFGPMPVGDWSGSNAATVWPQPPASDKTDNKNNSNSVSDQQNKVEKVTEPQSEQNFVQENIDSGSVKSVPENESIENQLVVKDSVSKDSAHFNVSANSVSSEPQDMIKSESINADSQNSAEVPKDDTTETKLSAMPLVGETSGDACNQSADSTGETDPVKSASCEKHAMEITDAETDQPPEKKLKIDHLDEPPVLGNVEREPVSPKPEVDEYQVPDSTEEFPLVQESSASCDQTEQSESATDLQSKTSVPDNENTDEPRVPVIADSEVTQKPEENINAQADSKSESTSQNTGEQDQLKNSLQNTGNTESRSTVEPVSESNVNTETMSVNADSVGSAEVKKTEEKQETQEGESAEEQAADTSSASEVMETDTDAESTNTAVGQVEAVDESEPMDQE